MKARDRGEQASGIQPRTPRESSWTLESQAYKLGSDAFEVLKGAGELFPTLAAQVVSVQVV